jgi:hypothetical protein
MLPSFASLPDGRKPQGKMYSTQEMMMGGLSLFLFKEGSRNQLNNDRNSLHFSEHYERLFGLKLPHQDIVKRMLCSLDPMRLDIVKMDLMSRLFEKKWLRKYRLFSQYYFVAVDATGIVSFDKPHCEHCLTKKSKNGTITYFHYVLEAKLVTKDGLVLSLASEWIENPEGEYEKQDCERKAFIRLAAKIKQYYPHLPICILADGLYPYENAFKTCEDYGWKFIFVLKNDSLKTVQEELTLTRRSKPVKEFVTVDSGWNVNQKFQFQCDILYRKKYTLNWAQCSETRTKIIDPKKKKPQQQTKTTTNCFEYVTNIKPDKGNIRAICAGGRLRWKIENEGFNTQKNNDYELEHKYCEKSYNGLQNYYTLLQIAHAINQFIENGKFITQILKLRPKETITNLWKNLKSFMVLCFPIYIRICAIIEHNLIPAPS